MDEASAIKTETQVVLFFKSLNSSLEKREHFYAAFRELAPKDWKGFVNLGKQAGYDFTIEELKAALGDEFYTGRRAAWKDGIFSLDYGEMINIEWVNKTDKSIYIHWIRYDGTEREFENGQEEELVIPPDGIYFETSYIGHVFRVRDAKTYADLGIITVDASKANYEIR